MTSQVYYRRWRPGSFGQMVGQEHVTTTLCQSTKQNRVSHSYLFCGPRGSGKTTTARILAKAVNCLDLQDGDPCNACAVCQAINGGRFMDIIELDAASNRGINEMRDIREKVNFSPAQGRRKVYIIDEAHMLTTEASNAFLKTLEEPPAHVIFILCTTEAHKILPTIISRCQRFDFRRIPSDLVYGRLVEIARAEAVAVEPDALRLVARYAAGSLRDAENLLEQLAVSYTDGVGVQQVEELLGLGHGDRWLELVKYLLMGNTTASLGVINEAAWDGADIRQLHRQVLELLRAAMLIRWDSEGLVDLPDHVLAQMRELVGQVPPWRVIKALKSWGQVNMRYDAPSTLPLELVAVEICDDQMAVPEDTVEGNGAASKPPSRALQRPAPSPPSRRASPAVGPRQAQGRSQPPKRPAPVSQREDAPAAALETPTPSNPPAAAAIGSLVDKWTATVKALARHKGKKYNLGALLRDCRPETVTLEAGTLVLPFSHRTNMERMQEEIDDPNGKRLVTEAVSRFFGASHGFRLTLVEENRDRGAAGPAQNSPLVRVAIGMGGRIIEEVNE